MTETTNLRWFEEFNKCPCGRYAQGILRGLRNESYGPHCRRCAARRLKASNKLKDAQTVDLLKATLADIK